MDDDDNIEELLEELGIENLDWVEDILEHQILPPEEERPSWMD